MDFETFVRQYFPATNASLNSIAAVLLVVGWTAIRGKREQLHKCCMIVAFAVSTVFLACYLTYHAFALHVKFTAGPPVSYVYYTILASHVLLAMAVPVLAIWSLWLGWQDRRVKHRRIGKIAMPIWLYVSVTGVVVYVMLYHLYPPTSV